MDTRKRAQKGLGKLYKRAHGRDLPPSSREAGVWWLEWREEGVRHRQALRNPDGTPCRTLREAEAERRRLRAPSITRDALVRARAALAETERLEARLAGESRGSAPGLPAVWACYVRHPSRRQCSERTLENYRQQWERMRGWLRSERPAVRTLDEVTPQTAADYMAWLGERTGASTYNRHLTLLRALFRLLSSGDPFADIPRKRSQPASRRALTREELSRLLERSEGEMRLLILLGASTGLRLGDCCTLRWEEVDADALCVRRRTRKTGSTVTVPIPRQTLDALGGRGTGYVLPGLAGIYLGRHGSDLMDTRLETAFRRAGIATHEESVRDGRVRRVVTASFHSLRHTWVSAMSEGGAPPALIQAAVGHSSPAMTEHYTHLAAEGLRRVADAVGGALMPDDPERQALEREVISLARGADIDALRRAKTALEYKSEE